MSDLAIPPAALPVIPSSDPGAPVTSPARAPETSTPAAEAPAAPKVDHPDVQATTGGRSDYASPKAAQLDLAGAVTGAALAAHDVVRQLPALSSPSGVGASSTVSRPLAKVETPDKTVSAEVNNNTSVSVNRSQTAKAGDQRPIATDNTSITVSNVNEVKLSVKAGPLSVSDSVSQTNVVKTDVARPVGAQGSVDPRNPDQMPVGSKVTVDLSASVGASTSGSVALNPKGPVKVTVGGSEAQTASLGLQASVEKVNDRKVRVAVGSKEALTVADSVNATLKLNDKTSLGVGLGVERGVTDTHLDTREFDLDNPAAREAYQRLITGQSGLPEADPARGIAAGGVDTFKVTQDTKATLEAKLGPLGGKINLPVTNSDGTLTVNRRPDGNTVVSHALTLNHQNVSISRTFEPDGQEDPSKRRYDFVYSNQNGFVAGRFAQAASGSTRFETAVQNRGPQDVQLSFTQADVDELRRQAAAHPQAADRTSFMARLAAADDTARLLLAFTDPRQTGGVSDLGLLGNRSGRPIPGQAWFLDRNTGETWRFDEPVKRSNGRPLW